MRNSNSEKEEVVPLPDKTAEEQSNQHKNNITGTLINDERYVTNEKKIADVIKEWDNEDKEEWHIVHRTKKKTKTPSKSCTKETT